MWLDVHKLFIRTQKLNHDYLHYDVFMGFPSRLKDTVSVAMTKETAAFTPQALTKRYQRNHINSRWILRTCTVRSRVGDSLGEFLWLGPFGGQQSVVG